MRGRPLLFTEYEADQSLLNTTTKKVSMFILLAFLVLLPFTGGGGPGNDRLFEFEIPFVGFLAANDWLQLLSTVFIFAIGALGLNILTGLAGQVSLGHAFFMGIGAYTAALLGAPEGPLLDGFGAARILQSPLEPAAVSLHLRVVHSRPSSL